MLEEVLKTKIVPVVVFNSTSEVEHTLSSLIQGDVNVAEICFRTECAAESIKLGIKLFPNMVIGAGTVINKKQAELAIECGVKFIVSPGLSKEVNEVCVKHNIPYIPGVVTPTEIMEALELNIHYLKFFPAGVFGGIKAIKALSSAFPGVKFMPTGGVNNDNLIDFVKEKCIFAVGGSYLLKGDIVSNCLQARKIIKENI